MVVLKFPMLSMFQFHAIPAEENPKRSRPERREVFMARVGLDVLPFSVITDLKAECPPLFWAPLL